MANSFVDMPVDIGAMVLNTWIAENQKMRTLSNVDVAFCNKQLRPIWLEVITHVSTPSVMGNFHLSNSTSCIPQLEWILSRRVKLSNLHIDVRELESFVRTAGNRNIPSLLSVALYSSSRYQPGRELFRRFLQLFPSLTFVDVSPWLSMTTDEYTVLAEIDGLGLQELVLENCRIPPEAVIKVVRPIGAQLRKFDGSMRVNVDEGVMEALCEHCPHLQHISMEVETKDDLNSLFRLIHRCADHIQHVIIHFAGSTNLAQDFGDFLYRVSHTLRQLTCISFGDAVIAHPHVALCQTLGKHRELVEYQGGGQSYRRSEETCRFHWRNPSSVNDFLAIFSAMADCTFPIEELVVEQIASAYSCWRQDPQSPLRQTLARFLSVHGKSIRHCKLSFAPISQGNTDRQEGGEGGGGGQSVADTEAALMYFPVVDLLCFCPELNVLDVRGCRHSSALSYQSSSAQLPAFPKLRQVSLSDAQFLSEAYIVQLVEKMPHLEIMNLIDCPGFSSWSLAALQENCPRMTELRGYNVTFSEKAVEAFQAARPHCTLRVWKSHLSGGDAEESEDSEDEISGEDEEVDDNDDYYCG